MTLKQVVLRKRCARCGKKAAEVGAVARPGRAEFRLSRKDNSMSREVNFLTFFLLIPSPIATQHICVVLTIEIGVAFTEPNKESQVLHGACTHEITSGVNKRKSTRCAHCRDISRRPLVEVYTEGPGWPSQKIGALRTSSRGI